MALSDKELLILDCFMYSDIAPHNGMQNMTLGDSIASFLGADGKIDEDLVRQAIARGEIHLSGDMAKHPERYADVLQHIVDDKKLSDLVIMECTEEYHGSIRGACFMEDTGEVTVAFRGTGGSYQQWNNNIEGYGDEFQSTQSDAIDWFEDLPYDHITVTGHSNGANEAMAVTIICGDKVDRCRCYEGQGFSDEFFLAHGEEIRENRGKITNISGDTDGVNAIMRTVAGETLYVPTEGSVISHGGYGILKENERLGNFDANGNFKESAFCDQALLPWLISRITKDLASYSQVPIVGSFFEFITDTVAILVGTGFELGLGVFDLTDPAVRRFWVERFEELMENVIELGENLFRDMVLYVPKLVIGTLERIREIVDGIVDLCQRLVSEIGKAINGLKNWYNKNFNEGLKYAEAHPRVLVDTQKMHEYAARLRHVNSRLSDLDDRMARLYTKVGWKDLWDLQRADMRIGWNSKVNKAASFLDNTANDYEQVEQNLLK